MSTQTLTEQVHLINIITIAEDRLTSNFKSIVNRLKKHDQYLADQTQQIKRLQIAIGDKIASHEKRTQHNIDHINDRIGKCMDMIYELKGIAQQHGGLIGQCQGEIESTRKQIVDLGNIFQEKLGQNRNQAEEIQDRLNRAQADIYKAYEEILKKEDSTQVLKIHREVEGTKQKIDRNQKQYRLLEHKLEKIQIQNQKSQRNQSKKQIQLMREIEERIKKQVKNIQKNLPASSRYSSPGVLVNPSTLENNENSASSSPNQSIEPSRQETIMSNTLNMRMSFKMEEEEAASVNLKNGYEKVAISKVNEKLDIFQNKIKTLENTVNSFIISNKKSSKPESQELKQKINQIKPELIRIWAKCDTLDDRIAFGQRKIEEKSKLINSLLENQRENSVGRVDQRLKIFQTEVYTIIKELRTKIQAKVNTQDYEKYTFALDERLRQLSEIVFLKSDKLQVKKALLFLESKIKEIILVISEDEQNEKDALLTKKQLKCMSCDKDIDKLSKFAATTNGRGNWDAMPNKQHSPEILGKFGMTGFGSLSKKLKKLESKDLPVLKSKKTANSTLQPIVNTIPEAESSCQQK